ncbi:MAG: hypothetical protein AAF513_05470 [Pseudomonadota bacterium]
MRNVLWVLVFSLLSASGVASAAEPRLCTDTEHRQFDFWLGEWVVHTPDGRLAGHNSISREEGGCLLVERWRSVGGGTGQSYNYFDKVTGQWHQLWVSQAAVIDYAGGADGDGVMRLEGQIRYQPDGRSADFRGVWRKQADGTVLQELFEHDAASGEYKLWFKGVYSPSP